MQLLRRLGAAFVLGLLLFGAPWALAGWGRFSLSWLPLARADEGTLLLTVLTVVGWLAWAAFAVATVVEAIRLLGPGHRRVRLPLLGGVQQLSAGLIVAALALVPHAPRPVAPAVVASADPEPPPPAVPPEPDAGYLVEPGDDLWGISERLLGEGSRWRELVAANPDQLSDPTARLAPGTRLALPASTRRPQRVTVQKGDTLSGLALEHLGAAGRWPRIARANDDLIDDPDHIEVGWRLELPGTAAARRTEPRPAGREQEERPGRPEAEPPAVPPSPGGPASPSAAAPAPSATVGPAPSPEDERPALPLLGTLGTLAAAAIIGVVETRRFLRLRERPVGRRLVTPDEAAAGVRAALHAGQSPDRLAALDAALRAIGRYCHESGMPLPELARVLIGPADISIEWARPAGPPPPGFTGDDRGWECALAAPPAPSGHPCPWPLVVSLGSTADGWLVLVDAERSRVLGVAAGEPELRRSTLAALAVELACAPWAAEARMLVAGADAGLVALAGGERVDRVTTADAVSRLRAVVADRRRALGAEPLAALRVHPDRADAVAPVVACLLDDVAGAVATELDELLAGPPVGVAVVLATSVAAPVRWEVGGDPAAPDGRLTGSPGSLLAHALPGQAREGLAGLLRAADDPTTTPAPWWSDPASDNVLALPQRARRGEDPVDIVKVMAPVEHPQVLLIGPVRLEHTAGPQPTRSRHQLVELCAWLLEHPGSTATETVAGLNVAEGTRRSNLSRLRAWLGDAPDGAPYLPDAYSGRVLLHPGVSSDWHRLQTLLAPGADRVSDATLVAALELVRGAPLADAAPGQWHWAEELRIDISCALRDVGVELSRRALDRGDIDLARWAAARALVVAAEDELLLCARIMTEHRAGNTAEVERLVAQVTRQARVLGVDLLPETVELCQLVLEGRPRARA